MPDSPIYAEKILIIIPTYQEVENIKPMVEAIMGYVPQVHILFVDDDSRDGTREEIANQMSLLPNQVFILPRGKKLGLGSAYVAGFQWGLSHHYDILIEMDADFSHHPKYLKDHLREINNSDFVIGSRNIPGGGTANWSLLRKIISRGGSFYAKTILGLNIHDLTGGFNSWRAKVLQTIALNQLASDGYAFQIELKYQALRSGFTCKEFPILFEDRRAGHSKMSFKIFLEALWRVWLFRWKKPTQ